MEPNQSRRRMEPGPENAMPQIDKTLPYEARELDENSIRLVEIEPATNETDLVACTLHYATFGSKPKFEALSYMWGTETVTNAIILNGHPFTVTRNLLDALHFLRRQVTSGKACQKLWIDAICIDQSNVGERNRQLRIMDQIYFRAATVVVWLGGKYSEFQKEMALKLKPEEGENQENDAAQCFSNIQQNMVRYLRTDPYWDRIWILQEIGTANRLRVCFGDESCSWDRFMHLIALHNSDGNTGPLRLNRLLRQEKYNGSHTLKRLLEEHKYAKCSEPRDKIYGLVGLASDAAKFPMDYTKTLFDVWKDTMVFMNQWGLFQEESQILLIGALVKSALLEKHADPLSQISGEHKDQIDATQLIENPNSSLSFCLDAVPLGCIIYLGPSARDVVSKAREASAWRAATQRRFPAHELGEAHKEHDTLLRALLQSEETKIESMCFNRPSSVVWEQHNGSRYQELVAQVYVKTILGESMTTAVHPSPIPERDTNRLASVQPQLYLVKKSQQSTARKMGIASGLAQHGDLVCWVRSSRRAVLVRVVEGGSYSSKLRVFGTAMATEDVCDGTAACDYLRRWESLKDVVHMKVRVDADTIFMLLE